MRILYISLKADFGADGDESKGLSYEYTHIWDAWNRLAKQGDVALESWWIDQSDPTRLEKLIDCGKYDFVFSLPVNWTNDAPYQLLEKARAKGIPIVQFDCDPLRRLDNPGDPWIYNRFQRGLATHFLCPAPHMIPEYQARGMPVREMLFGCPSWIDRLDLDQHIDVSFVGQQHGIRQQVIDQLRAAGLNVKVYGHFWPNHPDNHGPVSEEEMNAIFNRSKVNLNLTWISQPPYQHQIKGRHFELLGAGACQVATYGPDEMQGIQRYMTPNVDFIQVYTIEEMIFEIKELLTNYEDRWAIGDSAYHLRKKNLWTTRLKEFVDYWPEWRDKTL